MYRKRGIPEQEVHDAAIKQIVEQRYGEYKVITNPGEQKNQAVNGRYPDIVAFSEGRLSIITEVETEGTITETEGETQWRDFASIANRLGINFYLYVPETKIKETIEIIKRKKVEIGKKNLRAYSFIGTRISIRDIEIPES